MTIQISILIIAISTAILFLSLSIESFKRSKINRERFELEKYTSDINIGLNTDTFNLLDTIINIKWQDTLAHNIDVLVPGTYINSSLENELRKELKTRVEQSLTNFIYNKLLLIYTEDQLTTVISEKIYNIVESFKLETNNTPIESVNKKK